MGLVCGMAGSVKNAYKLPNLKIWRKETICIKCDIKQTCVGWKSVDWINLFRNTYQRRALVNTAMKLPIPLIWQIS
jgi:hypothetical protein